MAAAELTRLVAAVHGLAGPATPHVQGRALTAALGECLGADAVTIALRSAAGCDGDGAPTVDSGWTFHWAAKDDNRADAEGGTTIELREGGHALAELTVAPPRSGELVRDWPELHAVLVLLLSDIAAQFAAEDFGKLINRSAADLADARLAAAAELEQQRYQLERDLHDGAQHHMVALRMALAMVEHQLDLGDPAAAAKHLDRLRQLLTGTEDVLYATATGLLAQHLAEQGLAAALAARLGILANVTVDIEPLLVGRRYPPQVEATVYLACLEAVSNAYKHAPGAAVTVTLRTLPAGLGFEVVDTGPGFPDEGPMPLRHLAARLDSVGGKLWVICGPAAGTHVTGYVKL
jgi:signal transduction histidine kinase